MSGDFVLYCNVLSQKCSRNKGQIRIKLNYESWAKTIFSVYSHMLLLPTEARGNVSLNKKVNMLFLEASVNLLARIINY